MACSGWRSESEDVFHAETRGAEKSSVRILIAEDEPHLSRQLAAALSDAGYAVDCALDGERADFLGATESYDAVILDLGLPRDGRADAASPLARRRAGDAGARPHRARQLAREGPRHRRRRGRLRRQAVSDGRSAGPVARADPARQRTGQPRASLRRASCSIRATRASRSTASPVKLTSHEFRVLSYLMHHRGRVVSQSELTEHIYAQDFDRDSNTVEVFIARLRRKLGASFIETVRGLGYRIEATDETG